ncbi:hypothetical protein MRX96_014300 [Rhipicephalus microplus]
MGVALRKAERAFTPENSPRAYKHDSNKRVHSFIVRGKELSYVRNGNIHENKEQPDLPRRELIRNPHEYAHKC